MHSLSSIDARQVDAGFLAEVKNVPGGEKVEACIQCGTCTGSCPTSAKMDYTPRKLIAMVRAGLKEQVLSSNAIWLCASCYTCTARCPRGIVFTDVMYALKNLAYEHGYVKPKAPAPVFYAAFNRLVEKQGRLNERHLMIKYALKTDPMKLLEMAPVGIGLFLKRRLPLFPETMAGKREFRRLMVRTKEAKA